MTGEFVVALISAAVALLSVALSVWSARSTARLQDELEQRRQQASKEELVEQVMSRYREPLLRAAFDLQSRIYNIVRQRFLARYLQQGGQDDQRYACHNTMFVFAEYLGWVEILRRGVQFLDLGDVRRNRLLVERLEAIGTILSTDRDFQDAVPCIFRGEQRAIGELMMDPAQAGEGGGGPPVHRLRRLHHPAGARGGLRPVVRVAGARHPAARGQPNPGPPAAGGAAACPAGPDRLPGRPTCSFSSGAARQTMTGKSRCSCDN
jgi:hypothetical protein